MALSPPRVPGPASDGQLPEVVYWLLLAGTVFGLPGVVGVLIAHAQRDLAPHWQQSHYLYQIRTFWVGLALVVLAGVPSVIGLGLLPFLPVGVWYLARLLRGLVRVRARRAIPDPLTLLV